MSIITDIKSNVRSIRFVPPSSADPNCDTKMRATKPPNEHEIARPTLQIISYNKSGPPDPEPDLEYDCRMALNPDYQLRHMYSGKDIEMQHELLHQIPFQDALERAEEEIRHMMEVKDARARDAEHIPVVRVGCLCGSGHHRSVAFAEQLQKVRWPAGWEVTVRHRDLTSAVQSKKEENRNAARNSEI